MLKPVERLDAQDMCELLLALEQQRSSLDAEIRTVKDGLAKAIGVPAEGAHTAELSDFKVTVNQPIYRKVDEKALAALDVSDEIKRRAFRAKHDLNVREWRYFANNEPEIFRELAACVTEKPGAVSVKVERRDS